ncbi:DUF6249 domain-containing protein [Coprobacter tertius]|uniref:DUF6249 domain-containing protein n=1 Tax=Coprobacter tertius TaxID=2944915 RepID=A0ABT1MI32_9BACT|nr:DUF6249 domain-containing protein [Coprobacter tertius]MCP9612288.1 hypothetical protein [Coprobacter tertius]
MFDFLTAPLVVGILTLGIYALFDLLVRRKERMAIIDKLGDKLDKSMLEGKLKLPTFRNVNFSFTSLKIGTFLTCIGIGILVGYLLCAGTITSYIDGDWTWEKRQVASIIYGSCILISGGIGLLIAFFIELTLKREKKEK